MVCPQHRRTNTPTTYDIFPRLTLNYGYDAMGQLQKVTSGSGPGVDLVNSATYNAAGQLLSSMRATAVGVSSSTDLPTSASLGLETFQYNGRNQLTEQTGLGTDINYWYSATANDGWLAQKHNWVTGEEENYTYDSLGRLATAYTTGPQWGLSFVYDGFGNRLQQNVTKGTAPSTVQTVDPLTNRLNGAGFGYDSNGNMTGWSTPSGSVTASYDVENRMTQIVTPSVTETYKYGPGNLRLKKYQGGAWTYTVYGQGGEVLGTYSVCTVSSSPFLCQAKLRVYFGGRLVVNGWTGVKPDRLGSPDGTHGRVYPYGEVSGSVSVDQDETFTTYKRDVYTGLDYAQNRYYASSWGRFTTADPYRARGGASVPQSWNRYSYVGGDPINRTDPKGLFWCTYLDREVEEEECWDPSALPQNPPITIAKPKPSWQDTPLQQRLESTRDLLGRLAGNLSDSCMNAIHESQDGTKSVDGRAVDAISKKTLIATFGAMTFYNLDTGPDLPATELYKNLKGANKDAYFKIYGDSTIKKELMKDDDGNPTKGGLAAQFFGSIVYFTSIGGAGPDAESLNGIATALLEEALHNIGYGDGSIPSKSVINKECIAPLDLKW